MAQLNKAQPITESKAKKVRNVEWDEVKKVYMDIITVNRQTRVQFCVIISKHVNANAYLTGLNLCINGAYGPIDSELWLHRARTQASDISHLEKLHNLTLWLDEPSKIWNKKRRCQCSAVSLSQNNSQPVQHVLQ